MDAAVIASRVEHACFKRGFVDGRQCRVVDRVGKLSLILGVIIGQVGADFLPVVALVFRAENILEAVVNDIGIVRRQDRRRQPLAPVKGLPWSGFGIDVFAFPLAVLVFRAPEHPIVLGGIDQVGIGRVYGDDRPFATGRSFPAHALLAEAAAGRRLRRAHTESPHRALVLN